jgi:hypothetical protein
VSTSNGIAYFKAPAPDCQYEAALTQALAHWRPDCTVPLLASVGLPETLVHEEVHSSNVLLRGDRFIFTDWSEAVVAHHSRLANRYDLGFWLLN